MSRQRLTRRRVLEQEVDALEAHLRDAPESGGEERARDEERSGGLDDADRGEGERRPPKVPKTKTTPRR